MNGQPSRSLLLQKQYILCPYLPKRNYLYLHVWGTLTLINHFIIYEEIDLQTCVLQATFTEMLLCVGPYVYSV